MAKTKELKPEDIIASLPALKHEQILQVKEAVEKEHESRMEKAANDLAILKNGGK